MGYTSGTAMEDRGLRDIERWRDKIEVRLDNRQVFFLFFGSALVACMLFVLGVIVGKRLESRGRAVSPEIEDPLALLDKVGTSPRTAQSEVTFPQALFGSGSRASGGKHDKMSLLPAATHREDEASAGKVLALTRPAEVRVPETKPAVSEGKPAVVKPASKAAAKPVDTGLESKLAAGASEKAKPAEVKDAKPVVIPTVAATGEGKGKGHFALQLSSFQDKSEAQAFAQKFENEHPYMIVSDLPGKGIWYRVRVGDFASAKDALAAKQSFEKKHGVIAYVAQR